MFDNDNCSLRRVSHYALRSTRDTLPAAQAPTEWLVEHHTPDILAVPLLRTLLNHIRIYMHYAISFWKGVVALSHVHYSVWIRFCAVVSDRLAQLSKSLFVRSIGQVSPCVPSDTPRPISLSHCEWDQKDDVRPVSVRPIAVKCLRVCRIARSCLVRQSVVSIGEQVCLHLEAKLSSYCTLEFISW
jgi:hypothetical protein